MLLAIPLQTETHIKEIEKLKHLLYFHCYMGVVGHEKQISMFYHLKTRHCVNNVLI